MKKYEWKMIAATQRMENAKLKEEIASLEKRNAELEKENKKLKGSLDLLQMAQGILREVHESARHHIR